VSAFVGAVKLIYCEMHGATIKTVPGFFQHAIKENPRLFPRSLSCTVYILYDAVSTVHI
jgi:hypothetical protein